MYTNIIIKFYLLVYIYLDNIELHDIGIVDIVTWPDKSGIFTKKSEALKYFESLDK